MREALPYILAIPKRCPASPEYTIIDMPEDPAEELAPLWEEFGEGGEEYLVIDLETKGTEAHNPACEIVQIGIYSPVRGGLLIECRTPHGPGGIAIIAQKLAEFKIPLMAFNAVFEGAFLTRYIPEGQSLTWHSDVYVLSRLICGEGWEGQRWGLKFQQESLLLWENAGDEELDKWLVDNGHCNNQGRATKSLMHLAPTKILGHYCILDCYSTHLLYKEIYLPVMKDHPILFEYMEWFGSLIREVVVQQLRGIAVDMDRLEEHRQYLESLCDLTVKEFLGHPLVSPHVAEFNRLTIDAFLKTRPEKTHKQRPPEPKEPAKFRNSGEVSKSWLSWQKRKEEWDAWQPEITYHYGLWLEREKRVYSEMHFNLRSDDNLRWLFYDRMQFPVKVLTDSDLPSTSGDALLGFGEPGKILGRYKDADKELGYVKKALEMALWSQEDGCHLIHPQFKVPGTITCRLAGGGGLNFQQVPKTPGYLSCYVARPGMRLVDIDYSGLEDYVLAELSRDPAMLALYGPDASPHQDGYIYIAAKLGSFGKPFLEAGYDPDNPTKEAVDRCKNELKSLRGIAKVLKLRCNYGSGPKSAYESLVLQGVKVTLDEVKTLHAAFHKLFEGNAKWARRQGEIHELTGGWVLDGLGGPVAISPNKLKDLGNRIVQRTGHLILVHYIHELTRTLNEAGIEWYPWIIDFHDEVILEVPKEQVDNVKRIMVEVIERQREFLGGVVKLKALPDEGGCLAPFKVEGFSKWLDGLADEELRERLR